MGELNRILQEAAELHSQGRYEEALLLYLDAVSRWPGLAHVWNNRGNSLLELRRFEEAIESYTKALELNPDLHESRVAMASCLQTLGRYRAALEACEHVLARQPDHAEAHWNRGLLLLLKGRYPEGWQEYEWRWKKRGFTSPTRSFEKPVWQGEPLAGLTILIHAEQGFGDTIQFCRYLRLLQQQGAKVVFECHPPLVRLMRQLFPELVVAPMGGALPDFDLHLPLLSLPLRFNTNLENIPLPQGYLQPPPDAEAFWSSAMMVAGKRRVGLCWSGKSYPDPGRSIPAENLGVLADVKGADFYSLQVGGEFERPDLRITDLSMLIKDFADTAALIKQLDLVITIDTSVAHLSGALGVETWLLLPFSPDWRWGLGRSDSPWYSSVRIFRQEKHMCWGGVLRSVAKELKSSSQAV